MSNLKKYIDTKIIEVMNKNVTAVSPKSTVHQAAQVMREHKIGAVIAVDGTALKGIFTERDVLFRVVCENLSPQQTELSKVMTKNVFTIKPGQTVEEAILIASTNNIRHLPVMDESKKILGMVSMKDILGQMLEYTLPL